jgi:ferredoxin-NADP reductase
VPFRAVLRHHAVAGAEVPVRLVYSSRSLTEVIYRRELETLAAGNDQVDLDLVLTREWPEDWTGHRGRIDPRFLEQAAYAPALRPLVYVCGPSSFVETVAELLVAAGHEPGRIRTERFGPTGT